jgi:IS4 transposase
MALNRMLDLFSVKSPITVMFRATLEYSMSAESLDELFRNHAVSQYEDELLFSTAVNTLSLAVCGVRKSVNAAYEACREEFEVSVTSLYNKLQGTEIQVSQALVRESATRLEPVIRELGAMMPSPVPGFRVRILDGNHLSGTQRRIKETRTLKGRPLPGHALAVLDPELMLMRDVFPCEDAYAQERTLLEDVLKTVQAKEVWIADRNFCTSGFVFGIDQAKAYFIIREHAGNLSQKTLKGRRRLITTTDTSSIYEQTMHATHPETGDILVLRRITVVLNDPTRDGDQEIHILTNLPSRVKADRIAEAYRKRWKIENAFQELGQALESEINTLCYPKAALLCFCVALYTYNILSVVKASLRAEHGAEAAPEKISGYYLGEEISAVYGGMMIAISATIWRKQFQTLTPRQMAKTLRELSRKVRLQRFRKRTRGPKKPQPKRTGKHTDHVSTKRILDQRRPAAA